MIKSIFALVCVLTVFAADGDSEAVKKIDSDCADKKIAMTKERNAKIDELNQKKNDPSIKDDTEEQDLLQSEIDTTYADYDLRLKKNADACVTAKRKQREKDKAKEKAKEKEKKEKKEGPSGKCEDFGCGDGKRAGITTDADELEAKTRCTERRCDAEKKVEKKESYKKICENKSAGDDKLLKISFCDSGKTVVSPYAVAKSRDGSSECRFYLFALAKNQLGQKFDGKKPDESTEEGRSLALGGQLDLLEGDCRIASQTNNKDIIANLSQVIAQDDFQAESAELYCKALLKKAK